jgi:hypothetical protein
MTREGIEDFAAQVGIAPGIVVGRLHHERLLPYDQGQDMKIWYRWEPLEEALSQA